MPAKFKHEFVFNEYAKRGYTLLDLYKGNNHKSKVICPNGCVTEMRFSDFKGGHGCALCAGVAKLTHEYVFNEYAKKGYKLKTIYINSKTDDELDCPDGHPIKMKYNNFQNGNKCVVCKYINMIGEKNPNYKTDRTRSRRIQYLRFDMYKLNLLKDDPNYEPYVQAYGEAEVQRKLSGNRYIRSLMAIDHIQPRVAFVDNNLDNIYCKKLIKEICNNRDNLKIITRKENGYKGGKYNQDEFMSWFSEIIKKY
jgi:hypothetical protein